MDYSERVKLIADLERIRSSTVITYILADRETFPPGAPGYSSQMSGEVQPLFYDQLRALGKTENLDLFLYTRGGMTDCVWPLVNLLRNFCKKLTVIVPFRAHSAGTLICLGADEIIMTDLAELSPIDPTTGNQFNPTDPANPLSRVGISVEDVTAYFTLAKERGNINDDHPAIEVFKELTAKVHPLAIGNVQRVYMQIRQLARRLLALHMDEKASDSKIKDIVDGLTEKFYSHLHAIPRSEAIPLLGKWVREPRKKEDQAIWRLFESYVDTLSLRTKLNMPIVMGDSLSAEMTSHGGFLESKKISHLQETIFKVAQRPSIPSNVQVQIAPGQNLPFEPWVGRQFDFGIRSFGWKVNERSV